MALPEIVLPLKASVTPSLLGGFPVVRGSEKRPITTNDPRDVKPIKTERAQELYFAHEASECREVTVQSHKYRRTTFSIPLTSHV
jgi:hypothetical protein